MSNSLAYFKGHPQPKYIIYNGVSYLSQHGVFLTLPKDVVLIPDYIKWRAQNRIRLEGRHQLTIELVDGRL